MTWVPRARYRLCKSWPAESWRRQRTADAGGQGNAAEIRPVLGLTLGSDAPEERVVTVGMRKRDKHHES